MPFYGKGVVICRKIRILRALLKREASRGLIVRGSFTINKKHYNRREGYEKTVSKNH